jgi:hypothetical protein
VIVSDGSRIGAIGTISLLAIGLAGCSATSSGGFVDEDVAYRQENPENAVIRRMMEGLGAVDPSRKAIKYAPRSPLVMPPTRDLPTPSTDDVETTHAGIWPKDPELAAAEQRRKYRDKMDERQALKHDGSPADMTNEERAAFRSAASGRSRAPTPDLLTTSGGPNEPPPDIKKDTGKATAISSADGTPVRRTLVDPPIEYQTPASTAPIVDPEKKKKKWWKVF